MTNLKLNRWSSAESKNAFTRAPKAQQFSRDRGTESARQVTSGRKNFHHGCIFQQRRPAGMSSFSESRRQSTYVTELASMRCLGEVNVKSTETDGVPDAERYNSSIARSIQLGCGLCGCAATTGEKRLAKRAPRMENNATSSS
jgi:hypothetical protein